MSMYIEAVRHTGHHFGLALSTFRVQLVELGFERLEVVVRCGEAAVSDSKKAMIVMDQCVRLHRGTDHVSIIISYNKVMIRLTIMSMPSSFSPSRVRGLGTQYGMSEL